MSQSDDVSMALFCDFENVALGVRDAKYEKFDMRPVLERLLLKGSIVVKKAYCDWDRYKGFKAAMHEANFELIEIPHVRQSGKNSADIRMVVDALDLCYTKSHVNTFVIISGDSDFSPLVSKLRENAKRVIGVGVKQSTSDLLIANCDEFIYYDDLVRSTEARRGGRRDTKDTQARRSPEEESAKREEAEAHRHKGIGMAVATLDALLEDRADDERVWASVLKEALKRRNPGFNETYFGFKSFGALLEEAHKRELLEFGRDEKSGAWVKRRLGAAAAVGDIAAEAVAERAPAEAVAVPPPAAATAAPAVEAEAAAKQGPRRRARGRKAAPEAPATEAAAAMVAAPVVAVPEAVAPKASAAQAATPEAAAPAEPEAAAKSAPRRRSRGRKAEPVVPAKVAPKAAAPRKPRTTRKKKTAAEGSE